jgi:hypothetical protein
VILVKNYKKSKRIEYFQRRDHLFEKISELNIRNSEAQFISARYEIVRLKKLSLIIEGGDAEETKKQCASIEAIIEGIEGIVKQRANIIESLHSTYEHLTFKTDAILVENLIALVKVVSDDVKKHTDAHLATLHSLEENFPLMKDNLTQMNQLKTQQAELELELVMKRLNEKASKEDLSTEALNE